MSYLDFEFKGTPDSGKTWFDADSLAQEIQA